MCLPQPDPVIWLVPAGVHTSVCVSWSQAPSHSSRPPVPPCAVRGPLPQTAGRPLPHQQPVWVSHLWTASLPHKTLRSFLMVVIIFTEFIYRSGNTVIVRKMIVIISRCWKALELKQNSDKVLWTSNKLYFIQLQCHCQFVFANNNLQVLSQMT